MHGLLANVSRNNVRSLSRQQVFNHRSNVYRVTCLDYAFEPVFTLVDAE